MKRDRANAERDARLAELTFAADAADEEFQLERSRLRRTTPQEPTLIVCRTTTNAGPDLRGG